MQRFRLFASIIMAFGICLIAVADAPEKPIRVAVYSGAGTSASIKNVLASMEKYSGVKASRVSEDDIRSGKLKEFDIVLCPGGSGSKQGKALGVEGRDEIRKFVKGGGAYIGICAGAYLASRSYDWSLHILDAEVLDREHWARGFGDVDLKLSSKGCAVFQTPGEKVSIYYHQGPLLAPGKDPNIPDFEALAEFETEIAKNGAPKGVMKGATAVAAGSFGSGKVICFSPHPEKTETTRELLERAVRWSVSKESPR